MFCWKYWLLLIIVGLIYQHECNGSPLDKPLYAIEISNDVETVRREGERFGLKYVDQVCFVSQQNVHGHV